MSSVGLPTPEFGKSTRQKCLLPGSARVPINNFKLVESVPIPICSRFPKQDVTRSSTVPGSNLLPSWTPVVHPTQWSVLCSVYSRCPVDSTDDYVGRLRFTSSLCPSSTVWRLQNSRNQMKVVTTGHSQRGRRARLTAKSRFPNVRRRPSSRELLLSAIHTPATQSRDILAIRTVTKSRESSLIGASPLPQLRLNDVVQETKSARRVPRSWRFVLPAGASIRPNGRSNEKAPCSPSLHRAKPLSPRVSALSLIENNR